MTNAERAGIIRKALSNGPIKGDARKRLADQLECSVAVIGNIIWNIKNPNGHRRYRITHQAASENARAAKLGLDERITPQEWREVLERHNHRCVICNSDRDIDMDHIVPLANGGRHRTDNIQPLCHTCNLRKGAR